MVTEVVEFKAAQQIYLVCTRPVLFSCQSKSNCRSCSIRDMTMIVLESSTVLSYSINSLYSLTFLVQEPAFNAFECRKASCLHFQKVQDKRKSRLQSHHSDN